MLVGGGLARRRVSGAAPEPLPRAVEGARRRGSAGRQPDRAREAVRRGPRQRRRAQPAPGRGGRGRGGAGGLPGRPRPRHGDGAEPARAPPRTACSTRSGTATHIERVEILWEETLALEGRAGYYDRAGALKDVLQNHMLQVLCLVAMEPPASVGERELRDRKVDVLRSVRPLTSRRARYGDGRAGRRRRSEWRPGAGVRGRGGRRSGARHRDLRRARSRARRPSAGAARAFVLRCGKACERRRKGVVIRFRPRAGRRRERALGRDRRPLRHRPAPHRGAPGVGLPAGSPRRAARGAASCLCAASSSTSSAAAARCRYARRSRVVMACRGARPRGMAANRVPLEEYPAGSDGP